MQQGEDSTEFELASGSVGTTNYTSSLQAGEYTIFLEERSLGVVEVEQGGVYSLLVAREPGDNLTKMETFTLTQPNSIHIFWLFHIIFRQILHQYDTEITLIFFILTVLWRIQ